MVKGLIPDPFEKVRRDQGYTQIEDQDDPVTMLLRLKDVRKCAHDWKTFQSGAMPGRIVVPSEVKIRETRQIPFEVDPPLHGDYRSLLDEWFRRPKNPEYESKLKTLVHTSISEAISKECVEVVSEFALTLQSRALTVLLNIPLAEAKTWIGWGTHVFRSETSKLDASKANVLYDYIDLQIDKAIKQPGEDLYSVLLSSEIEGRKLTKEEVKGVMILTFAGGRDTVINYVSNTIAYLAEHPEQLRKLREEPDIINHAVEELVRYFSPLTHMGRVVTQDVQICEYAAKADTRISLCWASANRDENTFERPNEIILDRKINPHVAFGFSHHKCLGATHARQLMKVLLEVIVDKVQSIEIISAEDNIEEWGDYQRKIGYHQLHVRFNSMQAH